MSGRGGSAALRRRPLRPSAWRTRRGRGPTPLLVLGAVASLALASLPLVYLLLRVGGGGSSAWSLLGRDRIGELVWDTALLVIGVCACSVAIAVPLAWLVTRTDLPGRRLWATAAALPLVIPSYVAALCLLGAFGPRGLLQQILGSVFGVERLPEIYGYPGALLALTLSTYPYVLLLTAAGFRSLDPGLEEASRALGRSPSTTFFRITLPAVRPAIATGTLLVALYTLSDFGAVSLMQYDALTRAIYLQYRALFDRTPAAALALVLVALTALVLLAEAWTRSRGRGYRSVPGASRVPAPVRLGRWRWPALAFCAVVVSAFLAVPLAVLGYWLARGLVLGNELGFAWGSGFRSLFAAGLAALAAVAAVLPLALLATRYRSPWTASLERAGYATQALPGIVIALSLVFFAARYASPVYQTLYLLVAAYVVRFYAQALAGVSSGLGAVSPRQEEAARSLGRRPLGALVSVTLPLARPGLLAGAALVFLSTLKELPATLLLRPIGFETLATEIWRLTSIGAYARAALPALVLIAISAPFVYLLQTGDRIRTEARPGNSGS